MPSRCVVALDVAVYVKLRGMQNGRAVMTCAGQSCDTRVTGTRDAQDITSRYRWHLQEAPGSVATQPGLGTPEEEYSVCMLQPVQVRASTSDEMWLAS